MSYYRHQHFLRNCRPGKQYFPTTDILQGMCLPLHTIGVPRKTPLLCPCRESTQQDVANPIRDTLPLHVQQSETRGQYLVAQYQDRIHQSDHLAFLRPPLLWHGIL